MVSPRLKHSMRAPVAATAVAVAVTITPGPALADPQLPDNTSDTVKQLRQLSREAEELTEKYKKAKDDHAARTADLKRAGADAAQASQVARQARAEEEKLHGKVDHLTSSAYQGARLNKLSALLISETPKAFLDRASTLDAMARDNNEAIQALSAATEQAEAAQRRTRQAQARAAKAEADAARIQDGLAKKKAAMDAQVAKVKQHYKSLSSKERDSLSGSGSTDVGQLAGSGTAVKAVNAALSKQGTPYVYGAKGPNKFDCSGLVQWAYEQAGVSLPASTQSQKNAGKSVSQSELKPGDVIFFYSSASHDGIYIGGGKVVHAPTEGQDVKVEDYKDIGDVNRIRRYAG